MPNYLSHGRMLLLGFGSVVCSLWPLLQGSERLPASDDAQAIPSQPLQQECYEERCPATNPDCPAIVERHGEAEPASDTRRLTAADCARQYQERLSLYQRTLAILTTLHAMRNPAELSPSIARGIRDARNSIRHMRRHGRSQTALESEQAAAEDPPSPCSAV